jgi:hypothetical protein
MASPTSYTPSQSDQHSTHATIKAVDVEGRYVAAVIASVT